ncbi:MAG: pentapeptide MXKDX repeat protein [Burkholderiaceae bacterium]|nr:pentapeptide MXKDX repeat protein [Burkholderiaceae bacterium]
MNKISTAVTFACMTIAAGTVFAADAMKPEDGMMKKEMTMQQCKDHMAMSKKDGMKKDDATMKMEATCKDMMAKDPLNVKKPGDQEAPMKK